jgi:hypothetical protein
MIAARLLLAGFSVFRPYLEDTAVDLLLLSSKGIAVRCQCKCVTRNAVSLRTTRKWGPNTSARMHRYTCDEVDFFLGYDVEADVVYVIPATDVVHLRSAATVRERYANAFHLFDAPAAAPVR